MPAPHVLFCQGILTMILTALCAALPLTTPAVLFQEGEAQVDVQRTKTPVEVVVGPVQVQEPEGREEIPAPLVAQFQAIGSRDDKIPLPIPAVGREGEHGDVLIRPASGDPYFLGLNGGKHYPPANELVDPLILERYQPGMDSRPGDFTYAYVMFSKRMTEARLARLEALGCRVLGFHPHYAVRTVLPPAVLTDVSVLPFVRWVGQAQARQKYHPGLQRELAQAGEQRLNVIVNLFESDLNAASVGTPGGYPHLLVPGRPPISLEGDISDNQRPRLWKSNGWMQHRLEELGLEVQWYSPRSMSIQGWLGRDELSSLVELDFVSNIEVVPEESVASVPHDESIALITADYIRNVYPGDTNQVAIVGVQDSGIESNHSDFSGLSGIGWDCTDAGAAWNDAENSGVGHGTHVACTLLGRGATKTDLLGVAPGLGSWGDTSLLYNLRRFGGTSDCTWSLGQCIDVFQTPYKNAKIPHLITNSWGYTGIPFSGTESQAITLDMAVYVFDQLWIFSAGNDGPGAGTINGGGSAKNVLTVGSVEDYLTAVSAPGQVVSDSSRGPMGDGRWKPNIVAPGKYVESARADNNTGYVQYTGTSMAAPHVAGVAATLVDHYNFHRYDPALTSASLMATAITKDDQVLTSPSSSHLDSYGAGRVSAVKVHYDLLGTAGFLDSRSFDQNSGGFSYGDFTVPAGTRRLVAVMHYVELPCSPGASVALVNDFDLWLDRAPIDPAGNTGEYLLQQSTVDNTEIRIIDSPASGAWRWKTYPDSVFGTVKMAVVIYAIFDDTTPDATLTLAVDDSIVQPGDTVSVSATVDPTEYIASAVVLARSGSVPTIVSASTDLYDGIVTDLSGTRPDGSIIGSDITLGDIYHPLPRTATWGLSYAGEGTKFVKVDARSDNIVDQTATISLIVDGTAPGSVSALTSSSHTAGVWSNNPNITWTWTAATDALSGLQGYGIYEVGSCSIPSKILDIGAVTTYTGGPYSSGLWGRSFNIRSVDNADNWEANYVCDSNYLIDVDDPTAPTFNSSSHNIGGKSCNSTITVNWNAGTDAHSGVDGYGFFWSTTAADCGSVFFTYTTGTSETESLPPGNWYLHVFTQDVVGNWTDCSDFAHFGPFTVVSSCTLFSDDFESGGFAAGGWTTSSSARCKVNAKSAFTGAFGARLKKGGQGTGPCTVGTKQTWIQAPPVDTTGWSGVRVDMNAHFRKNTLSCEGMALQWWDGAAWQTVGIVEAHPWASYSFNLPAGALGNPALFLALITNSKGKGEKAELDDFAVIGIE
jgi:hypothetical protein